MDVVSELCEQGETYADSKAFLTVMIIKLLLMLTGYVCFAVVCCQKRLTSIFHPNARLILKFHIGFVLVDSLAHFTSTAINLLRFTVLRWLSTSSTCPVPPISPVFMFLELIKYSAMEASTFTATTWALERIYATVFISSYEKQKNGLGWILCFISLSTTVTFVTVRALMGDYSMPIPMVMITGTSYRFNMIILNITASLEMFNVLSIVFLYHTNLRRLRKVASITNSLTYKYQLRENLQATLLIFPLNLVHSLATFPVAVLILAITNQNLEQTERTKLYEFSDWLPMYYVALPLLLWWRNGVMQSSIQRLVENNLIGERFASERREGKVETAKYFAMINQMWSR